MHVKTTFFLLAHFMVFFCFVATQGHAQASNWRAMGFKYLNAGQPKKAISFFRLAVSADPSQGRYREELAYALQESGMYDEALNEYTAAIGLLGASIENIKYNIALIYAAKKDYTKADQYISEVISMAPEVSSAYLNRANFRVQRKNYVGAEADYKKYLAMEQETQQRENIQRMLEILAGLSKFPANDLEKEAYNRKKQLEDDLNQQRKKIDDSLNNKFLGTP